MLASLDGLLGSSEARRSVFNFSISILWYLRKVTVASVSELNQMNQSVNERFLNLNMLFRGEN